MNSSDYTTECGRRSFQVCVSPAEWSIGNGSTDDAYKVGLFWNTSTVSAMALDRVQIVAVATNSSKVPVAVDGCLDSNSTALTEDAVRGTTAVGSTGSVSAAVLSLNATLLSRALHALHSDLKVLLVLRFTNTSTNSTACISMHAPQDLVLIDTTPTQSNTSTATLSSSPISSYVSATLSPSLFPVPSVPFTAISNTSTSQASDLSTPPLSSGGIVAVTLACTGAVICAVCAALFLVTRHRKKHPLVFAASSSSNRDNSSSDTNQTMDNGFLIATANMASPPPAYSKDSSVANREGGGEGSLNSVLPVISPGLPLLVNSNYLNPFDQQQPQHYLSHQARSDSSSGQNISNNSFLGGGGGGPSVMIDKVIIVHHPTLGRSVSKRSVRNSTTSRIRNNVDDCISEKDSHEQENLYNDEFDGNETGEFDETNDIINNLVRGRGNIEGGGLGLIHDVVSLGTLANNSGTTTPVASTTASTTTTVHVVSMPNILLEEKSSLLWDQQYGSGKFLNEKVPSLKSKKDIVLTQVNAAAKDNPPTIITTINRNGGMEEIEVQSTPPRSEFPPPLPPTQTMIDLESPEAKQIAREFKKQLQEPYFIDSEDEESPIIQSECLFGVRRRSREYIGAIEDANSNFTGHGVQLSRTGSRGSVATDGGLSLYRLGLGGDVK